MSNKTSDKMSDKLLPCPFCGGEARMQKKFFNVESVALMRFQVACMECGANNDWYTDKGYAIKAWNTRKPMEWYEELESKLQSVYGECDGLLKAVVDGVVERLVKHEGAEFEKLNKARLLMDENVEKWDRLKGGPMSILWTQKVESLC